MTKWNADSVAMEERSESDKRSRKGMPSMYELREIFTDEQRAYTYLEEKNVFGRPF